MLSQSWYLSTLPETIRFIQTFPQFCTYNRICNLFGVLLNNLFNRSIIQKSVKRLLQYCNLSERQFTWSTKCGVKQE